MVDWLASGVVVRVVPLVLVLVGCGDLGGFGRRTPDADAEPPVPEATPPYLQFGERRRDETTSAVVQIANQGGSLLDVEAVDVEGDGAFTLGDLGALPAALAHGEGIGVPVSFRPRVGGIVEGSLVVRFAALDAEPLIVPLVGSGTAPRLVVDPDPIDLGRQFTGCFAGKRVQLTNAGKEDLRVDAVALEDVHASLTFGSPPELPVVLRPGRSQLVSLAWFAEGVGDVGGALVVTSDDPGGVRRVPIVGAELAVPSATDTFTTPEAWGFDVVFAIDQSCSMETELSTMGGQLAAFADRLAASDAAWRFGMLGGEDPACFVGGVVDPSQPDWRDRVTGVLGDPTPKPWTEALLAAAADAATRDVPGGCNDGFRRPGAELHVVLISDERDQSPGFDTSPGAYWVGLVDALRAWAGDPDLLRLHAIVDRGPGFTCGEAPGGYAEAVAATGGELLDLCGGAWVGSLDLVASQLAARVGRFELSRGDLVPDTLAVTIDGQPRAEGWTYEPTDHAVTLAPAPPAGSTVEVTYALQVDCAP